MSAMGRRTPSRRARTRKAACALRSGLRRFGRNETGVAAVEFALIAGVAIWAFINVVDIGLYLFQQMEVENATQAAAQAAWTACDLSHLPATVNCPGLNAAVTAALGGTSLGNRITLQPGAPAEGYYCVNTANTLQYVSTVSSKPANCQAVGAPSLQPGDYISIRTTFAYAPLFPVLSIAGTLPTPITRQALMRLG